MKNIKLVLIEWIDSLRDDNSWVFKNDLDHSQIKDKMIHESVGWVIKETKDFIALAHSRTVFVYEDGDSTLIQSITIPKCSIKKIHKLN